MKYLALDKKGISKEEFIKLCNNNSIVEVLKLTGLHRGTFTKYAKKLKCFNPNQGGKGNKKNIPPRVFDLNKWENNEPIFCARVTLRRWIFKLELLPYKCNNCKKSKWLNKPIPLELNHIDGVGHNNVKSNIELLCPNCHAFTPNYRGKNNTLPKNERDKRKKASHKKYRENNPDKKKFYSKKYQERKKLINQQKRNSKQQQKIQYWKDKIQEANIDFSKKTWGIEVAKLMDKSPQYCLKFVKENLKELIINAPVME